LILSHVIAELARAIRPLQSKRFVLMDARVKLAHDEPIKSRRR